jgi:integrase
MGQSGGHVVPSVQQMPLNAEEHMGEGMLAIPPIDLPSVTTAFLSGKEEVTLFAFELPSRPGLIFVPNEVVIVGLDKLEVMASEVEILRRSIKSLITPEQIDGAKTQYQAVLQDSKTQAGKKSNERLSVALDAFVANRVRQDNGLESEITRIRNGCDLLIEMEGDLTLAEVNADMLRLFRDKKLARVPANENKIRLMHGTKSVTQSIEAVANKDWPVMSVSEREKRMSWISSWFRWLKLQGWISDDPAACLRGEFVLTKAQRRRQKPARRDDEVRKIFTNDDLKVIFSASWFKSGKGEVTKQDTYRTYSPLRYWLPLLGLFTGGGRINELSQLHLSDIRQTPGGTWYVDMNEEAIDQKLKTTPSKRIVPLHPTLIALGFTKWHAALVNAGYTRLFPELKLDSEKGYGKAATKWFTTYMASLGIPRDGTKTFHSFRHTYINALPADTPERIDLQLSGHTRGKNVHDIRYLKDVFPEVAAQYVNRLTVVLPEIAPFDIEVGLKAVHDALMRKNKGHGAKEDVGEALKTS